MDEGKGITEFIQSLKNAVSGGESSGKRKKLPMSVAERQRKYRQKKKIERAKIAVENGEETRKKAPMTSAERKRKYYQKKKIERARIAAEGGGEASKKMKKAPMSVAERKRKYNLKKKIERARIAAEGGEESNKKMKKSPMSSAERQRKFRQRRIEAAQMALSSLEEFDFPSNLEIRRDMSNKKRSRLTFEQKKKIIDQVLGGTPKENILQEYAIHPETLRRILIDKDLILEKASKFEFQNKRSAKTTAFPNIEAAVATYVYQSKETGDGVNGCMLQAKARELNNFLEESEGIKENRRSFSASKGWLGNFKRRYGMLSKDAEGVEAFYTAQLKEELKEEEDSIDNSNESNNLTETILASHVEITHDEGSDWKGSFTEPKSGPCSYTEGENKVIEMSLQTKAAEEPHRPTNLGRIYRNNKKRSSLTFEQKKNIIDQVLSGTPKENIVEEYAIHPETLRRILVDKDNILEKASKLEFQNKKSAKTTTFPNIDVAVATYFQKIRKVGGGVYGYNLQAKAREFRDFLRNDERSTDSHGPSFAASSGWFRNFKKRNGISSKDSHSKVKLKEKQIEDVEENSDLCSQSNSGEFERQLEIPVKDEEDSKELLKTQLYSNACDDMFEEILTNNVPPATDALQGLETAMMWFKNQPDVPMNILESLQNAQSYINTQILAQNVKQEPELIL